MTLLCSFQFPYIPVIPFKPQLVCSCGNLILANLVAAISMLSSLFSVCNGLSTIYKIEVSAYDKFL